MGIKNLKSASLEALSGYFSESGIHELEQIFSSSQKNEIAQIELLSVMQQEMSIGLSLWEISSDNEYHLVLSSNTLFLISTCSCIPLISDWLFFEGELVVRNIHWYEKDKILVFDLHFIVHSEIQKCICYYADDGFIWTGKLQEYDENLFIKESSKDTDNIEGILTLDDLESW